MDKLINAGKEFLESQKQNQSSNQGQGPSVPSPSALHRNGGVGAPSADMKNRRTVKLVWRIQCACPSAD